MSAGLDSDLDYIERTGIPGGGAGTLSGGAFTNFFAGVWLYRPSAGNSHALTTQGTIIVLEATAREIAIGYDGTFGAGTAGDPQLQIIFNTGGGAGTPHVLPGANFLDEWVYYFLLDTDLGGGAHSQTGGYIRLSAPNTVISHTRTNDNAGSQYINNIGIGNRLSRNTGTMGWYAYARFRTGSHLVSSVAGYANSAVTQAGDWAFWPLATNTDNSDTSGNSRPPSLAASLTAESSPALGGGGGGGGSAQINAVSGVPLSSISHRNGLQKIALSHLNGLLLS